MNHVTEDDTKTIYELLRFLNRTLATATDVDAEVALTDSNGDSLGTLKWHEADYYIWEFPA